MIKLGEILNLKIEGDGLTVGEIEVGGCGMGQEGVVVGGEGYGLTEGGEGGDQLEYAEEDEEEGWIGEGVPMRMKPTMGLQVGRHPLSYNF